MSCIGGGAQTAEDKAASRNSKNIERLLKREKSAYLNTQRLLLLGAGESGKSTVVKQMKILHKDGYSDEERLEKVPDIRSNVEDVIVTVLSAMDKLGISLAEASNEERKRYIFNECSKADFDFPQVFFEHVTALWKDAGVQACFKRSNEYQLIDSAAYFLDPEKLKEVSKPDYLPSDQDILRCRVRTSGIIETRFTVDGVLFHMFDVGGQRTERGKWFQCFSDVRAVLFVVSCSSFDMVIREDEKTNRLKESLTIFERVWENRWLHTVSVILFLNKQDTLKKKVDEGRLPSNSEFPHFSTYIPPDNAFAKRRPEESDVFLKVQYYIRDQFLLVCRRRSTRPLEPNGAVRSAVRYRNCYPFFTTAVDTKNVRRVFKSCRQIVQDFHLEKIKME